MGPLLLHTFHAARGAEFGELNGHEIVRSFGGVEEEYLALTTEAGIIDLSFRSRICVLGADREKFLHGQVTNDILRLETGQGCYAALVTHKGKLETDLFAYKLADELLLDFEPGLTGKIVQRLEKFVIAEDVQAIDVAPHFSLVSVQGPKSRGLLGARFPSLPEAPLSWTQSGDIYIMRNGRFGSDGYDLFVPNDRFEETVASLEGRPAGFAASEIARIENGIPRFGADMDETNLAPEAEIQGRAISYSKGCYIGQEVIARIRTYGQVAKALRLIRLPEDAEVPAPGAKLYHTGKEVGRITSSTRSPIHGAAVALAYIRKECNAVGETVRVETPDGVIATVIAVPGSVPASV